MKARMLAVLAVVGMGACAVGCSDAGGAADEEIGLPTRDDRQGDEPLPPGVPGELPDDGRTNGEGETPSGVPIPADESQPPPVTTPAPTTPFGGKTWKVATIIYRSTDVDVIDTPGGDARHVSTTMTATSYAAARSAAAAFPAAISQWSGDTVRAAVTIIDVPVLRSVSRPSTFDKGYWASPKDVAADLAAHAPLGTFDSVFVVWEPKASGQAGVPACCAWGRGLGADTNGMTFASVTPRTGTEGMVHEWLHGSSAFFRSKGLDVPDPHDNRAFGFPSSIQSSWSHWYAALMSGRLVRQNKVVGFTRSVWNAGTPTQWKSPTIAPTPRAFSLSKPTVRAAQKYDADWLYAEWEPTQGPKEYSLFLSVIKADGSTGKSLFKYDSGGTDRGAYNYFYWPMSEVCSLGKGTLKLRFQVWSADDDGSAVDKDMTGSIKCPQ